MQPVAPRNGLLEGHVVSFQPVTVCVDPYLGGHGSHFQRWTWQCTCGAPDNLLLASGYIDTVNEAAQDHLDAMIPEEPVE